MRAGVSQWVAHLLSRACLRMHAGSTAKRAWIGRVDFVEPGHDDVHFNVSG
jgi:hypothetical protein